MSSAVLYLAIVAVWGMVLVPMWLRRDGDGISRLLHRRAETVEQLDETAAPPTADDVAPDDAPAGSVRPVSPVHADGSVNAVHAGGSVNAVHTGGSVNAVHTGRPGRRRRTRGAVIARRRRRTLGLGAIMIASVVTMVAGATPWWFMLPPTALLGGHIALLRVAVRMDSVRRQELHAAAIRAAEARRARAEREEREAAEASRTAQVIELPGLPREEVYDQYTDRRAVGD